LQLADPVPALGNRQIGILCIAALDPELVKLLIVKATEMRRRAAERPDQPEARHHDCCGKTELLLLRERESTLGLCSHLIERDARREHVPVHVVAADSNEHEMP